MVKIENYSDECGILMQGLKDRGVDLPITRWRLYFKLYPNDADTIEKALHNANIDVEFYHINPIDISPESMRYLVKILNKFNGHYDIKLDIMKDRIIVMHNEPTLAESITYLKSLPILNQEDNLDWEEYADDKGTYISFIVSSKDLLHEYKKSMEIR